jgi:hypothetical protein
MKFRLLYSLLLALTLLAPLASCSKKKDPEPTVIGTWQHLTTRIQSTFDADPSRNSDVTYNHVNRQVIFATDGTCLTVVDPGSGVGSKSDYSLSGRTITYASYSPRYTYKEEIVALSTSRMVLFRNLDDGGVWSNIHTTLTSTYAR